MHTCKGVGDNNPFDQAEESPYKRMKRVALMLLILLAMPPVHGQTVPSDPEATCTVSATEFNTWFQSGAVTLNGVVNPANSVAFSDLPNCDFYKWSERMFLWLTSPTPPIYGGGGGHIFESASFFGVSPPDPATFRRTFIPHRSGLPLTVHLLARQFGPNLLPVVIDKQGRMFEVEPPPRKIEPLRIRSTTGRLTEITRVRMEENGKRVFLDKAGRSIEPRLAPPVQRRAPNLKEIPTIIPRVRKFALDGIHIFVDLLGNVIDVEQGQAGGGGVLIAQNGSLIYYTIAVNEVFAYFRTQLGGTSVPVGHSFPTTQAAVDSIKTFAGSAPSPHKRIFVDPEALAVEVKASWIEVTGIPDPENYITMTATIPTYDKSNANKWVPNGKKTATLAMVGMHVVGSTKGHPEMIWATFEHIGNAPDAAYSYVNTAGSTATVPQNTAGTWLFCAGGSTGPFNNPRNSLDSAGNILGTPVGPDNIIRWKAWGAASDLPPNFRSPERSNSELIALNNSVRSKLVTGDVRANYIMTGSTWTIGGAAPTPSNQVGTSKMNNATMETFTQGSDNRASGTLNCFSCHSSNQTRVSHIFSDLQPLF